MADPITPNMGLTLPVVGSTLSPTWAEEVNNNFSLLDQHDHSPGYGNAITPAGLSINSDLPFLSNNATGLRSVRFEAQDSPLSGGDDLGCLYVSGVDLYYNDEDGNQVRITASGGVNGSPGSIANLTSPASATYVSGDATFVWQSDVNTSANMDFASAILRNDTVSSYGLTLAPPNSMAADYTITLPSLPAGTSVMAINNAGTMSALSWLTVSGTTLSLPGTFDCSYILGGFRITNGSGPQITNSGTRLITSGDFQIGSNGPIMSKVSTTATQMGADALYPYTSSYSGIGRDVTATSPRALRLVPPGGTTGNIVTSNIGSGANGLYIVSGAVNGTTGAVTSGGGFTCVNNGGGSYTISFLLAFNNSPAIHATSISAAGFWIVTAVSSTACTISVNTAANTSFFITAIGDRL